MLMTTGFNFEGYEITDYMELLTVDTVVRAAFMKGFLAKLTTGISEFNALKGRAVSSPWISAANQQVCNELREKAKSIGANGVLGISFQYVTYTDDFIGVIGTGTAVKIKKRQGTIGQDSANRCNNHTLSGKDYSSIKQMQDDMDRDTNQISLARESEDGTSEGKKVEENIVPQLDSLGNYICPNCKAKNQTNRKNCFRCGYKFPVNGYEGGEISLASFDRIVHASDMLDYLESAKESLEAELYETLHDNLERRATIERFYGVNHEKTMQELKKYLT